MRKKIFIPIAILILSQFIHGACSNNTGFWQQEIRKSKNIETFFMNNYNCKESFYRHLKNHQKLYYDAVLYPRGLKKAQYKNRWFTMSLSQDKEFFKTFKFYNNYFNKYRNSITDRELRCFQKQKGFPYPVPKNAFYTELQKRGIENDVSYLYPLIRWSYDKNGRDMVLSRERVEKTEQRFGIKRGKVGDKIQFARYLAVFDSDYEYIANQIALRLGIPYMDAYKLIAIITYLESRGNIFASSSTGAFGPLQLTMHYYLMYGEPNNPFNPRASLMKLANKFLHYYKIGNSIDASVIAYKSGSLEKCQNGVGRNSADCKYYYNYKRLMSEMSKLNSKIEVSRYMTGKAYFRKGMESLRRSYNTNELKFYEPYQYAVLKGGVLNSQARDHQFKAGSRFRSLGKMKRSDIYKLQDRYGSDKIGVISDKKVCY
jgi:hypothetical protein